MLGVWCTLKLEEKMENWKVVENFEEYEVSDLGRVRKNVPGKWSPCKILSAHINSMGYTRVALRKNGKQTQENVHRLVAKAFIPNPLGLPQVNHKGEKVDNRAIMLEWISIADHGKDIARRSQRGGDGVCFNKQRQKWRAHYNPEPSKQVHLGSFSTYEEAKAARDAKVATL